MKICKRLHGFTLIELLIVITIIGILAVALVPRITGGPAKARDATRKADLQQIATALEFYNDDTGDYPESTGDCVSDLGLDSYLTTVPSDPAPQDSTRNFLTVTGGCSTSDYAYLNVDSGDGYLLFALLENASSQGDGIYEADRTGVFTITTDQDVAYNLSNNTLCEDYSGGCTSPLYVLGR